MDPNSKFKDDIDRWNRRGKGHNFSFYATNREIGQALLNSLPEEHFPPFILSKCDSNEVTTFKCNNLNDFIEYASDKWYLWILLGKLTELPKIKKHHYFDSICSINGLINLQLGHQTSRGLCESRLGLVSQIEDTHTKIIIKYDKYLSIYNSIKKNIKNYLFYTSIEENLGGMQSENTRLLISQEVAAHIREGVNYKVKIGNPN